MSHRSKAQEEAYRRQQQDRSYDVLDALIEHGPGVVGDIARIAGHTSLRTEHALNTLRANGYVKATAHGVWSVTDAGRVYAITPIAG